MKNRELYYYCGRNNKHDYIATPVSNIAVSGGKGSGKTYFLTNLIVRLIMECNPREVRLHLYEFDKPQLDNWTEAVSGTRVIPQMSSYDSFRDKDGNIQYEKIAEKMNELKASVSIKMDAMSDVGGVGISNIDSFNWERNIYIIEDLDKIICDDNPYVEDIVNNISYVIKHGESVGVYIVATMTSYDLVTWYMPTITDVSTKVCLKQTSNESIVMFGDNRANTQLNRYGDCFLLRDKEVEHLYVPFYPDTWIRKFIRYYGVKNNNEV